jgi:hypothetical protein
MVYIFAVQAVLTLDAFVFHAETADIPLVGLTP